MLSIIFRKKFFPMRRVRYWHRLLREVVPDPSLEDQAGT